MSKNGQKVTRETESADPQGGTKPRWLPRRNKIIVRCLPASDVKITMAKVIRAGLNGSWEDTGDVSRMVSSLRLLGTQIFEAEIEAKVEHLESARPGSVLGGDRGDRPGRWQQ
jgi:hypothetical protein